MPWPERRSCATWRAAGGTEAGPPWPGEVECGPPLGRSPCSEASVSSAARSGTTSGWSGGSEVRGHALVCRGQRRLPRRGHAPATKTVPITGSTGCSQAGRQSEAADHDSDEGPGEVGLAVGDESLVVPNDSARSHDQRNRPLHPQADVPADRVAHAPPRAPAGHPGPYRVVARALRRLGYGLRMLAQSPYVPRHAFGGGDGRARPYGGCWRTRRAGLRAAWAFPGT